MPNNKKVTFDDLAVLAEDQTVQSDKWATGISGRNMGTKTMTLLDLIQKTGSQHPNDAYAPPPKMYGTDNLVQLLGDIVVLSISVKDNLEIAQHNPIIRDQKDSMRQVDGIIRKVLMIKKVVDSIGEDIDNFSIDPQKSDAERKFEPGVRPGEYKEKKSKKKIEKSKK